MFSYYIANKLNDIFATLAPFSASPLLGFGDLPDTPINLIDVHGYNDDQIPIDFDHSSGRGPHNSIMTWDR